MAGVAQLVRAPDCGPGGREFDSLCPPHYLKIYKTHWGVAKWLRHRILIPAFVGSNPATPAKWWLVRKTIKYRPQKLWPISSVGRAPDF